MNRVSVFVFAFLSTSIPLFFSLFVLVFNPKDQFGDNLALAFDRQWLREPRNSQITVSSPASVVPPIHGEKALPTNITSVFSLPPPIYQESRQSPVKDLLKVYVYDNMPEVMGKNIEDFLYSQFTNSTTAGSDFKSELALIELFRSFPGRTFNPEEADIFVVPYAHAGHCWITPSWKYGCAHVPRPLIVQVFNALQYYFKYKSRHLFLLAGGAFMSHKLMDRPSLVLTTGPRVHIDKPGEIIMSQFNDDPRFQPSEILSKPEEWWTRPRKYAFSYFFGGTNANMRKMIGGRRFRTYFRQDMEAHWNNATIGGLPFQLSSIGNADANQSDITVTPIKLKSAFDSYENSVFCPILAGDCAWQRRFFDSILSGCLPLVLAWQSPEHPGGKSWFLPHNRLTFSVQQTYPFAKGVASPDVEIDYESFVVECPGKPNNESDVASLRQTMEDLLLNKPEEIKRRQLAMKKVALSFTFGLGGDAHRYEDEFARIIRSLRSYVDHLT